MTAVIICSSDCSKTVVTQAMQDWVPQHVTPSFIQFCNRWSPETPEGAGRKFRLCCCEHPALQKTKICGSAQRMDQPKDWSVTESGCGPPETQKVRGESSGRAAVNIQPCKNADFGPSPGNVERLRLTRSSHPDPCCSKLQDLLEPMRHHSTKLLTKCLVHYAQ